MIMGDNFRGTYFKNHAGSSTFSSLSSRWLTFRVMARWKWLIEIVQDLKMKLGHIG